MLCCAAQHSQALPQAVSTSRQCVLCHCRDLRNTMRCLAIGQFIQAMEHHHGRTKLPNANWLQQHLRQLQTRLGLSANGHVSCGWLHAHLLCSPTARLLLLLVDALAGY